MPPERRPSRAALRSSGSPEQLGTAYTQLITVNRGLRAVNGELERARAQLERNLQDRQHRLIFLYICLACPKIPGTSKIDFTAVGHEHNITPQNALRQFYELEQEISTVLIPAYLGFAYKTPDVGSAATVPAYISKYYLPRVVDNLPDPARSDDPPYRGRDREVLGPMFQYSTPYTPQPPPAYANSAGPSTDSLGDTNAGPSLVHDQGQPYPDMSSNSDGGFSDSYHAAL